MWPVEGGRLTAEAPSATIKLASPYGAAEKVPAVRALTVSPLDEDIVIGTATCDVIEVNTHQQARSVSFVPRRLLIACMLLTMHQVISASAHH